MGLKNRKIIITGGAGFIGSNIAEALCDENDVTVVDNLLTGRLSNLSGIRDRIRFVQGDINDVGLMKREMEGADYVLHQAALPSVQRSVDDPITSNRHNIDGTLSALTAAKEAGVKRLVFASSSSIYGDSPRLPKDEHLSPNPMSPYAITKLAGEEYCRVFHQIYGLETVALRYFNVFGPRQDPGSQYSAVIPLFIKALKEGARPTIYGDGEQSRDFTYVANIVSANILACTAPRAVGLAMNIACGERTSLNDLLQMIGDILGEEPDPIHEEPRKGDVKHSLADISRAREALGFHPEWSLRRGLEETVARGIA